MHLRLEQLEIVVEPHVQVRKHDGRADLRRKGQFLPGQAELPEQANQRTAARSLGRVVGHCMKSHVQVSAAALVERIKAADRAVAFQDAHALIEVGQADPCRQSRHASADYDRIVHM